DLPPADEVRLLQAIRARYGRRQAVLPIDLTVLGAGELARDAPLHELIRLRGADARPGLALADWRLLTGDELRPAAPARPAAPPRAAVDHARALATELPGGLRSVTVHQPPFAAHPVLLVECPDLDLAGDALRWAVDGGAAQAARRGLRVEVLTTRLAEDAWRT